MSVIQEPPLQRPFTMELHGQTVVDPIWGKWLFDLAQYINSLNEETATSTGTGAIVRQNGATLVNVDIGAAGGTNLILSQFIRTGDPVSFHQTSVPLNNGAGVSLGTLTTAPSAGPPAKWIGINDGGVIRYIPAW